MKTVRLLFMIVFMLAAMFACNLYTWDDVMESGITADRYDKVPRIFPGGNVECSQLGFANLDQTTGRNDYDPVNGFEFEWPEGLEVVVEDDGSVSFLLPHGFIKINENCYKVGSVIVKGSDASNVYDYGTDGAIWDKGLFPPDNASGSPAALSNLTFCFVEVECEKIVIALKTYLTLDWACTGGGEDNNYFIGFYDFIPNSTNKIYYKGLTTEPVGNITISNLDEDEFMEVTIDNSDNGDVKFTYMVYLYIGTEEGFNTTIHQNYPYQQLISPPQTTVTFYDLPF